MPQVMPMMSRPPHIQVGALVTDSAIDQSEPRRETESIVS